MASPPRAGDDDTTTGPAGTPDGSMIGPHPTMSRASVTNGRDSAGTLRRIAAASRGVRSARAARHPAVASAMKAPVHVTAGTMPHWPHSIHAAIRPAGTIAPANRTTRPRVRTNRSCPRALSELAPARSARCCSSSSGRTTHRARLRTTPARPRSAYQGDRTTWNATRAPPSTARPPIHGTSTRRSRAHAGTTAARSGTGGTSALAASTTASSDVCCATCCGSIRCGSGRSSSQSHVPGPVRVPRYATSVGSCTVTAPSSLMNRSVPISASASAAVCSARASSSGPSCMSSAETASLAIGVTSFLTCACGGLLLPKGPGPRAVCDPCRFTPARGPG